MPPKASKKRSRCDSALVEAGPPPIKFISPGLTVDTCITVFGQDYHVHSMILKLHSNYFRKFLDSADKPNAPATALFKYNYTTVVDDDGMWAIEPKSTAPPMTAKLMNLVGDPTAENEGFHQLLCAFYNRPYTIGSAYRLKVLVRLADYYCSLPIVSSTLTGALLSSPLFKKDVNRDLSVNAFAYQCPDLIHLAKKLRHPVLFRECYIHIVGNFVALQLFPSDKEILKKDDAIWNLIVAGHAKLERKLLIANQAVFSMMKVDEYWYADWDAVRFKFDGDVDPDQMCVFYQKLRQQFRARPANIVYRDPEGVRRARNELFFALDKLLENNLVLDQSGYNPGQGPYELSFLCANIADEDMPWNSEEIDF